MNQREGRKRGGYLMVESSLMRGGQVSQLPHHLLSLFPLDEEFGKEALHSAIRSLRRPFAAITIRERR